MKVLPDGRYRPIADLSSHFTLTIKLRNDTGKLYSFCSAERAHGSDYVEISQSGGDLFSNPADPCSQVIKMNFGKFGPSKALELEQLRASIGPPSLMSLDLMRDDIEWRFVLSRTDITTEKEARKLRVTSPSFHQWEANATVYFMTGECILDQNPPPAQ
jgi:hypothetical protein